VPQAIAYSIHAIVRAGYNAAGGLSCGMAATCWEALSNKPLFVQERQLPQVEGSQPCPGSIVCNAAGCGMHDQPQARIV